MTFEDIPQHLRTAAIYAEAATARRPVFVPRRLYAQMKEYLAWKESHPTRQRDDQTVPVTSHLGNDYPPPKP